MKARTSILCSGALMISLAGSASDSVKIERGRYLFRFADCGGCHSERDFSRFAGPVVPGGEGKGNVFPPELGLRGKVVAPNITPDRETGIGRWTDAEKIRAIRDGIGKDGNQLFPMMPYQLYRSMSDSDVEALVAYMNTMKPVRNALPRTELAPGVAIPRAQPAGRIAEPDRRNRVKYGEYLATIGGCVDCHTPADANGGFDTVRLCAGGREFNFPGGMRSVAANLTPEPETGIGKWTEDQFVKRFRAYQSYMKTGAPKIEPRAFTIMPWLTLADAKEEDLRAIYTYLRTLPPVKGGPKATESSAAARP